MDLNHIPLQLDIHKCSGYDITSTIITTIGVRITFFSYPKVRRWHYHISAEELPPFESHSSPVIHYSDDIDCNSAISITFFFIFASDCNFREIIQKRIIGFALDPILATWFITIFKGMSLTYWDIRNVYFHGHYWPQ